MIRLRRDYGKLPLRIRFADPLDRSDRCCGISDHHILIRFFLIYSFHAASPFFIYDGAVRAVLDALRHAFFCF